MLLRRWGRWGWGGSYAAAYKDDTSGTFLASYSFHSILITLHLQNEYTQGPYIGRRLWPNNEGACKKPAKKSPRNSVHRGGGVRNESRSFFCSMPAVWSETSSRGNSFALSNGPISQYSHFERSNQLVCSRQRHSRQRRENPGPLERGCALGRVRHVCRVTRVLARGARALRNDPRREYVVVAALIT